MKRTLKFCTLVWCLISSSVMWADGDSERIVTKTDSGITFIVDENLPPTDAYIFIREGDSRQYLSLINRPRNENVIAHSLGKTTRLARLGKDCFFQCMVKAYAEHRPLVLSPDIIWQSICLGFANYVENHAEELRDRFVAHRGKKTLMVESKVDLFTATSEQWDSLLNLFEEGIQRHTKREIADVMTADFSTTGRSERIASRVTLMATMQHYFEYKAIYAVCGIPYITLEGKPADWEKVREKARKLKKYGLDEWIGKLDPVLTEFCNASEGNINPEFWKSIVCKYKKELYKRRGGCTPPGFLEPETTKFDGWFLTLFPDKNGLVNDTFPYGESMENDITSAPMKYINADTGKSFDLNLWAGFVGVEANPVTNALRPKIGWFITNKDELQRSISQNDALCTNMYLRINRCVPNKVIEREWNIDTLHIDIANEESLEFVLDELLPDLKFGQLSLSGCLPPEDSNDYKYLLKKFPNVVILRNGSEK